MVESFFENWSPYIVGSREEIVVALDWTEFDADDHSTIALYLVTSHGRATPLMWKTVIKSKLEGWRNSHEDALISMFAGFRPLTCKRVTLLADRGFGDQKLYVMLESLNIDYIIRFRGGIQVQAGGGKVRTAAEWVPSNGRAVKLPGAKVTADRTPVPAVVCVHARGMKDACHMATSRGDLPAAQIVKLYGKRFTIEETFRDCKDARFGMGLSATHIKNTERRDRILILGAIAQVLVTLLGAAAEETGLDRILKVNTVKRRTHSLFRQGVYWYGAIPTMPVAWLRPLMTAFGRLLAGQRTFAELFGIL